MKDVIGGAFKVHSALGAGLFVEKEKALLLIYGSVNLDIG